MMLMQMKMLQFSFRGTFLVLVYMWWNDRSWLDVDLYHAQSHHIIPEEALSGYGGSKVPEENFR